MATIDRADWHLTDDFPEGLPDENSGTHIGMYINWIVDNNLIGETHLQETKKGINDLKLKKISGRDFFFEFCDGKFWDEDLNAIGLKFTEYYYSSNDYFNDYSTTLGDDANESIYSIENNWENYERLKKVIDIKFLEWKSKNDKKPWQFWK